MEEVVKTTGFFLLLMLCYIIFGFEPVALGMLLAIFMRLK